MGGHDLSQVSLDAPRGPSRSRSGTKARAECDLHPQLALPAPSPAGTSRLHAVAATRGALGRRAGWGWGGVQAPCQQRHPRLCDWKARPLRQGARFRGGGRCLALSAVGPRSAPAMSPCVAELGVRLFIASLWAERQPPETRRVDGGLSAASSLRGAASVERTPGAGARVLTPPGTRARAGSAARLQ